MSKERKLYIAPAAELILLAPVEALATVDDQMALNKWGQGSSVPITPSTVQGTYTWGEDGTIKKNN